MPEKTLEKVMREKITPMIEQSLHKYLGVTINELNKDLSDRIEANPLISFDISTALSFKAAKKLFKKQFLQNLIRNHYGNISEAAKIAGIDRRSVHRAVQELKIDVAKVRKEMLKPDYYRKEALDGIFRATLDTYKEIIHPEKLERIYRHMPSLAEDIAKELPKADMTMKEAEAEFERQYLKKALDENKWNISGTARKIKLRFETLHRKIKKLGIQRQTE
jgi:DNA-binding NtrC family response regulator